MIVLPSIAKKIEKEDILNKNNEGIGQQQIVSDDSRIINLINNRSARWVKIDYITINSADITYDVLLGTYTAEVSTEHGLGFAPVCFASYKDNSSTVYTPLPYTIQLFTGAGYKGFLGLHVHVDAKKIYFKLETYPGVAPIPIAPDPPYTIKYYISNIEIKNEE